MSYRASNPPELTPLERLALIASHQERWALGQLGQTGLGEWSNGFSKGFAAAMAHILKEVERMQEEGK